MGPPLSPGIGDAARLELFRTMVLIRTFERATLRATQEVERSGEVRSSPNSGSNLRLAAGREPVAAGVCAHLEASDALTAAGRPHHLAIAHGVELGKLADETLGQRRADPDLHHPWHLFDPDTHFTSSASTAEGFPTALGRAFSFQREGSGRVAVIVIDREAAEQDGFAEALELANLWSLPLIFVVEDEDWDAEPRSVPYLDDTARTVADYGVPAERVEDNAVETVHEAAARVIAHARGGGGPSVLEVHTVRLDVQRDGRRLPELPDDRTGVVGTDPVTTYERALFEAGVLDAETATAIHAEAMDRVAGTVGLSGDERTDQPEGVRAECSEAHEVVAERSEANDDSATEKHDAHERKAAS